MAEEVAEQLTANAYKEKIETARAAHKAMGLELYVKYIPEAVRMAGKEHSEKYDTTRELKFLPEGASYYDYIQLYYDINFPRLRPIIINKDDWQKFQKAHKLCKSLEEEQNNFKEEVAQALVNLRTAKNVREQFPEALPYMNFSECTTLVPNLSHLRNKLKQ